MNSEKSKVIIKIVISVAVIGVLIAVGYFVLKHFGITDLSREQLQDYINSTGVIAPLVFIGISFLQVTFVPIPSTVTILAGNYIFGIGLSFLYSYIGLLLGALFAFGIGKLLGRKYVNWLVGSKEKVDEWLAKIKGKSNVVLFFMFLLPGFPDDLLCSIAGITPLTWRGFFVMQLVTRALAIGCTLLLLSGEFIPYHGWGIPVLIALGILTLVAFVLCLKFSDKLNDWVNSIFKIKKKRNDE